MNFNIADYRVEQLDRLKKSVELIVGRKVSTSKWQRALVRMQTAEDLLDVQIDEAIAYLLIAINQEKRWK